jgi:hypothetical protein
MYKLAACYIVYSTGHFISGYSPARKSFDNCKIRISVQMTDVAGTGVEHSNPRMLSLNKRKTDAADVHVTQTMKDHFVNNIPYFSVDNAHLIYNARVIYIKNHCY